MLPFGWVPFHLSTFRPQSTDVLDFEPEDENGTEEGGEKVEEVKTGGGKTDWLNNVASPSRFDLIS